MAKQLKSVPDREPPLARTIPLHRASVRDQSVGLRLLSSLQTTLDPEEVLRLFDRELRALLAYEGLQYQNRELGLISKIGCPGRQRLVYHLALADDADLGELVVSRRARFQPQEIRLIEECLTLLIYPLRNATKYQLALTAARQDCLTGLGNRVAMEESLERELDLAQRHGDDFSIVLLDLDDFKYINDHFGHPAGDAALAEVAQILRGCARQSDLLFRYAGDEFVIAMNRTDAEGAWRVAERVRQAVQSIEQRHGEHTVQLRVSLGVAQAEPDDDMSSLFQRADQALLKAKANGRNRVATDG